MLAKQRHDRIRARVRAQGAVRVSDLVAELGVSDMTVRRDISELAARGVLRKVHGGAVDAAATAHEPAFESKRALALDEKRAIAREALAPIQPGSSVALSAGTTTQLVAEAIAARADLRPLTVVTNSLPAADTLFRAGHGIEVVLTGGSRTPSDALVGPLAVTALENLRVDVLFLGAHGLDADGLTTPNLLEAETNRALARAASRVVVVADSSKWGTVGLSRILPLAEVDVLVTDDALEPEARTALADAGTSLHLVPTHPLQDGAT